MDLTSASRNQGVGFAFSGWVRMNFLCTRLILMDFGPVQDDGL